jgi:hypothetical protein
MVVLPESWYLRIGRVTYSSAASGSPYSASRRDRLAARSDSVCGCRCPARSLGPGERRHPLGTEANRRATRSTAC